MECFELLASGFLFGRHPPFAPQFAVGEPQHEVGVLFNAQIEVKRIVLAVFERLEPVDYDRCG